MLQQTVCLWSRSWAAAQARDPYVHEARRKGYIARSAFKLLQLDEHFHLLNSEKTKVAIDLGASPGGWCQVLRERAHRDCVIFGVDMIELRASIPNAHFLKGDFSKPEIQRSLLSDLDTHGVVGQVDIVTSDMW